MRHYLVTGGLGFLGSALVRRLVKQGNAVRILDDASRGSTRRLSGLLPSIELIQGDIRDPDHVSRAVNGVDSVCHLAFINGTRYFYEQPADVLEVGVKGMLNVLDACRKHRVEELVLASSSEVYQTPPAFPADEEVPLVIPDLHNPRYSYAAGKIISEVLAVHYGAGFLKRVLIFRPHNVFGPDMGWEHVIPELTLRILKLKTEAGSSVPTLTLQGDGQQSRSFIYIDDFIEGLLTVLEHGEHLNVYHIGTSEEIRIRQVAEAIARCLDVQVRVAGGQPAQGGVTRRVPNIEKLHKLGFQPRTPFQEGLRRTVEWYAAQPAMAAR